MVINEGTYYLTIAIDDKQYDIVTDHNWNKMLLFYGKVINTTFDILISAWTIISSFYTPLRCPEFNYLICDKVSDYLGKSE